MASDPKPDRCPFCKDEMESFAGLVEGAFARSSDGGFSVNCDCGAIGPTAPTMAEAIEAWNSPTREARYWSKRHFALIAALRNWPCLPDAAVLKTLGSAASFPEDWERGKRLQRKLGFEAIPPVTECECGAGLWDRLRSGADDFCAVSVRKEKR